MEEPLLKAFWIVGPSRHGPLGFGVTAWSLEDALRLVRGWGYELPEDVRSLTIREGVTVAELEYPYVIAHMGPIVVRGVWYPFRELGVPEWLRTKLDVAEERV